MLVAQNAKGCNISINRDWSRNYLLNLKKHDSFICPSCKQPVLLRVGNVRIPHFSHMKKDVCDSFSEGESTYHLEGKLQLYEWLSNLGYNPQLEQYFRQLKQRPDLFVSHYGKKFMIEYQCSALDTNRFKERTENYRKHGFETIWILGAKRLKRTSKSQFTVTSFDWMCTKLIHKKPCLLYYCTEQKKFLLLQDLIPLSTSSVIANLVIISPTELKLQSLYSQTHKQAFPVDKWLHMKKNWRLHFTKLHSVEVKVLLRFLYERRISPSLLPSEIGIPVPSMYWIQTHPILWQAWILLEFIELLPKNSSFTFQSVYHFIKVKRNKRKFICRELPLIKDSHYSFAIMEYLDRLADFKLLKKGNNQTFTKVSNCHFPPRLEDATLRDEHILTLLKERDM